MPLDHCQGLPIVPATVVDQATAGPDQVTVGCICAVLDYREQGRRWHFGGQNWTVTGRVASKTSEMPSGSFFLIFLITIAWPSSIHANLFSKGSSLGHSFGLLSNDQVVNCPNFSILLLI